MNDQYDCLCEIDQLFHENVMTSARQTSYPMNEQFTITYR